MMWMSVLLRAASRLPWQIWATLAVAVVLGVSAWQIDSRAYNRGFAASDASWVSKVNSEIERQVGANGAALAAARDRIRQLTEAKEVRDATIERLNREASGDPNAGRESLSVDGVRRLNNQD